MECNRCYRTVGVNSAGYCPHHWEQYQGELKQEKIDELRREIADLERVNRKDNGIIEEYQKSDRQKTARIATLGKDLQEKTILVDKQSTEIISMKAIIKELESRSFHKYYHPKKQLEIPPELINGKVTSGLLKCKYKNEKYLIELLEKEVAELVNLQSRKKEKLIDLDKIIIELEIIEQLQDSINVRIEKVLEE